MKHGRLIVVLAWCCGLGWGSLPAAAQSGSGDFDSLRGRGDLNADQVQSLDSLIDGLIDKAARDDNPERAGEDLLEKLRDQYLNVENTPRFKSVLAERCATRFAERAAAVPQAIGVYMLYTLQQMPQPSILEGLKRLAGSPSASIRYLAVATVPYMSAALNSDAPAARQVLDWLSDFGSKDNTAVLQACVYRSTAVGPREEQVNSLMKILNARLAADDNSGGQGERAELVAFLRLQELATSIPSDQRQQVTQTLARFLVRYVHRYIYADLSGQARTDLVRLITVLEDALTAITTTSGPQVFATALGSAADDRYDQIRTALETWVDLDGSEGRLKVAPAAGLNLDFTADVPFHPDDPEPVD